MNSLFADRVRIETLPTGGADHEERRLFSKKGEMAQILNRQGDACRHLVYWDLDSPKTQQERGQHYHLRKTEQYYILTGELELRVMDPETKARETFPVKAGQRITVNPKIAHAFRSLNYAQVLEYAPASYDPTDTVACPL